MSMSTDFKCCKICDDRLISLNSSTCEQRILDYSGIKVQGRKFPAMSAPENLVEQSSSDQKVFLFGGTNTMYRFIDDEGYYMYDAAANHMSKLPVLPE